MNKKNRILILAGVGLILIGFLVYLLVSRLGGNGKQAFFTPQNNNRAEVNASPEDAAKATNALGFQLLSKAGDENIAVANASMANMLQLYVRGNEDQKAEVDAVMGTQGDTKQTFAAMNNTLEPTTGYKIVSGLWVQNGAEPSQTFLDANKYYRTYFAGLDFADSAKATDEISRYLSAASSDKLDQGMTQLQPNAGAALAGGISFEGEFDGVFAGAKTQDVEFKGTKETGNVSMLQQTVDVKLYEDEKVQFAVMPLKNGYSLEVCMPRSFGTKVNSNQWKGYAADAIDTPTQLTLPNMEIYNNKAMDDLLKQLGVNKIFTESNSDVGGANTQFKLTRVDNTGRIHIRVSEQGESVNQTPDATILFNKPFYYAICHNETGARVICGQYVNPQ